MINLLVKNPTPLLFAIAGTGFLFGRIKVGGFSLGVAASGTFAGGLTNTPALAGVLEFLQHHRSASELAASGNAPVVGYSLAYPFGVLIPLGATYWLFHSRRSGPSVIDREAARRDAGEPIVCKTVRVRSDGLACPGDLMS